MIQVNQCGYHTHNPDGDRIYRPGGLEDYVFLLILSPMVFDFSHGHTEKALPGACILYAPNSPQDYWATDKFFNSYLEFNCPAAEVSQYQIMQNRLFYPEDTEEINWLLKKLYHEFINRMTCSQQMLDAYARQLLIHLHRAQRHIDIPAEQRQHIYPELTALREQILKNCQLPWSITQMCEILNLGKSQLYQYYHLFFHTSPKEELIQARLQKARYLMTNQAMSIKRAAYESGFAEIAHFNRLFKKRFCCTPGEYRKKAQ